MANQLMAIPILDAYANVFVRGPLADISET